MRIIVIILVCGLFFLNSCAPINNSRIEKPIIKLPSINQADTNGTMVLSLGGEPSILNPILSLDSASSGVEGVIFNGLVRVNASLEIEPELAKYWTVSKNGLEWIFYLREDVYWHDNQPFTAKDVEFTFNAILNPKINSVRRSDFIIDGMPIIFKAINRHTFKVTLPKPFAPFLSRMGMGIIPYHILKDKDINTAHFNRQPIGTGPFKFKEWHAGDYVKVERNNNYFLGKPKLSQIVFKIIPDGNTALLALEAKEVDEAGIPARDYKRVLGINYLNVFTYNSLVYTYLGLNLSNPLFADKKVRKALAYATNKDQLISLIFKGLASPAYCSNAPISWAYSENNVVKHDYNLKKAKDLLKQAGWNEKDGKLQKDGKDFEFTILVNQGNKEREKAATILQQQYKKVGIKVNVRVMEWSAMLKVINSKKIPKEFDAVLLGWSLGLDPDQYSIWHSSQYPKGFNFINYQNPQADKLLKQGRITMQKSKRKEIYSDLNKIISDDQPYIFLWYPEIIVGINQRVGGLNRPGPAGLMLNIEKIFVTK